MPAPRVDIGSRLRDILEFIDQEDLEDCYGRAISRALGVPYGSIHSMLARMCDKQGLLTWQDVPVSGGSPHRCYRLTSMGRRILGRV